MRPVVDWRALLPADQDRIGGSFCFGAHGSCGACRARSRHHTCAACREEHEHSAALWPSARRRHQPCGALLSVATICDDERSIGAVRGEQGPACYLGRCRNHCAGLDTRVSPGSEGPDLRFEIASSLLGMEQESNHKTGACFQFEGQPSLDGRSCGSIRRR